MPVEAMAQQHVAAARPSPQALPATQQQLQPWPQQGWW